MKQNHNLNLLIAELVRKSLKLQDISKSANAEQVADLERKVKYATLKVSEALDTFIR